MNWTTYLLRHVDLYINTRPRTKQQLEEHYEMHGRQEGRVFDIMTFAKSQCDDHRDQVLIVTILAQWASELVEEDSVLQTLFTKTLSITDALTQAWLMKECFAFEDVKMHKLCSEAVASCLQRLLSSMERTLHCDFHRPSRAVLSKAKLTLDSMVPIDMDWRAYRDLHAVSIFERICGRWYWFARYVTDRSNPKAYPRVGFLTTTTSLDGGDDTRSSPVAHVVLCAPTTAGESHTLCDHLEKTFSMYRVRYRTVSRKADLCVSKMSHQKTTTLWIVDPKNTDISAEDVLSSNYNKIIIVGFLDAESLFTWCGKSSVKRVFDRAEHIVCPSEYMQTVVHALYPPETQESSRRIVVSPPPDICHYDRTVRYRAIRKDRINIGLCGVEEDGATALTAIRGEVPARWLEKMNFSVWSSSPADDSFYDWLEKDEIHGLILSPNKPHAYSYRFSQCVNSGIPCLYKDMDGAIKDRIRTNGIAGMYASTPDSIDAFFEALFDHRDGSAAGARGVPPRNMTLSIPPFYRDMIMSDGATTKNDSYVRPFAVYFPQFYRTPENDVDFYEGMTDMVSLKKLSTAIPDYLPLNVPDARWKSSVPDVPLFGVNSFYDLDATPDMVQQQVALAKRFGFQGFAIYHYWFSTNTVTHRKSALERLKERFFHEALPEDFTVFFNWVNGDWTDGTHYPNHCIRNTYRQEDFQEHLEYLMPFFLHRVYEKIDNKPVLLVHHAIRMTSRELDVFFRVFDDGCRHHGFDGVHLVLDACGGFHRDGYLHYRHNPDGILLRRVWEQTSGPDIDDHPSRSFSVDMKKYIQAFSDACAADDRPFVEVVFPSFNANARYFNWPHSKYTNVFCTHNDDPEVFRQFCLAALDNYRRPPNRPSGTQQLFLVNAWNEWGEDMKLEPSKRHHFGYLQAFSSALQEFRARS